MCSPIDIEKYSKDKPNNSGIRFDHYVYTRKCLQRLKPISINNKGSMLNPRPAQHLNKRSTNNLSTCIRRSVVLLSYSIEITNAGLTDGLSVHQC